MLKTINTLEDKIDDLVESDMVKLKLHTAVADVVFEVNSKYRKVTIADLLEEYAAALQANTKEPYNDKRDRLVHEYSRKIFALIRQ